MFLTSMVLSEPIDTELRNLASKKLERHSTVWCTCTTYFDTLNRIVNEAVVLVYWLKQKGRIPQRRTTRDFQLTCKSTYADDESFL